MRVSLHVFVYNFFISEVKTGWVMTGQVSACPNISGWNVFGPKHIFGAKFLLNDFFFNQILLSHPFTFNCSSFNIATLGLYLRFSGWLKIWNVPVCKMEPLSGYIMQLEPPSLPDQFEINFCLQDGAMELKLT